MARKKKNDIEEDIADDKNIIEKEVKKPKKASAKKAKATSNEETNDVLDDAAENYILQNEMTLDEIQNFVNDIYKKISSSTDGAIIINLEKVTLVTTPIIQAVISLNRQAEDSNKKIQWLNPTSEFSEAFNNLGFYSEMMKLEFAA